MDMAKAEFVVSCRPEGTGWTATNDPDGIAATVARLRTLTPALIVAEATGGYERALVAALAAGGRPLVVANPRRVRDFAKATGSSPRPTAWMQTCWRSLLSACVPRPVRSRNPSCNSWTRC
jgi:transposase